MICTTRIGVVPSGSLSTTEHAGCSPIWTLLNGDRAGAYLSCPSCLGMTWQRDEEKAGRSGPCQGRLMFRRKQRPQLPKNIIAESDRIIEFGEDASYSLGSIADRPFRDWLCREPRKVVADRRDLRIKIGDLAWHR